jgi:uncharacterized membrane protein (DUF106 family)
MDDVETFLLIAAIGLCVMLIGIEIVDLLLFVSYKKEYEKYQEEFDESDKDGDNDDL